MGVLRSALKAAPYIHLGGGQGFSYPPSQSVVYQTTSIDDGPTATGKTVTDQVALSWAPFYAGTRLLSQTVGRMPLVLYERISKTDREPAEDKLLYGMLHDEPNPAMSVITMRSAMHGHVILRGNAYAERVRDDLGRDRELWPFRPDRMKVLLDVETGRWFYRYRIESLGDEVDLTAERVFHVPGWGYDGRVGYSLVSLFRETIAMGLAPQEFGARFFKNGARPAAIITHPKGMSMVALDEFATSFKGKNAGLTNAQRIALIEEGFSYEAVGMSLEDSQFNETRAFQRGEASIILGVPPHLIGDIERSTSWGTGLEEQTLSFISFGSLGAHLDLWAQETNRQLVRPAYGQRMYAEFLLEKLLQGRSEDRLRFYQGLWQMGVINADTIAAKENLPKPDNESGKTYYRPVNYQSTVGPELTPEELALAGARNAAAPPMSAADVAREIARSGSNGNGRKPDPATSGSGRKG